MNQPEAPVIPEAAALLISAGASILQGVNSWADFQGKPAFFVRIIGMGLSKEAAENVAVKIDLCMSRVRRHSFDADRSDLRYVVFVPPKSPRLEGGLEAGFSVFRFGTTLMTLQRAVFVRSKRHPKNVMLLATSPIGDYYLVHHSQVVGHNDAVVLPAEEPLMLPAPVEVQEPEPVAATDAAAGADETVVIPESELEIVPVPSGIPRPEKNGRRRRPRRERAAAKPVRRPTPAPVSVREMTPSAPKPQPANSAGAPARRATLIGLQAVRSNSSN